jgi:hypothetical protein
MGSLRVVSCASGVREMVCLLTPAELVVVVEGKKAVGAVCVPERVELRGRFVLAVLH